jgi:CBS domain-containing protein
MCAALILDGPVPRKSIARLQAQAPVGAAGPGFPFFAPGGVLAYNLKSYDISRRSSTATDRGRTVDEKRGQVMKVREILVSKGSEVATIRPDSTISMAASLLKLKKIGALVVSEDGTDVAGILSERDIVRGLVDSGRDLMDTPVSDLMTRTVKTCHLGSDLNEIMVEMTRSRIRHLPVVDEGQLRGIISIGDVVKNRLDELETETSVLRDYIVGRA